MLDALNYDDWVVESAPPERPHLESNRWLEAVKPTRSTRTRPTPETETIDFLGVKLVWVKDGGRPFPAPVLSAVKSLIDFAELPANWNSYGGRSLNLAVVPSVVKFIVLGHQMAAIPRLHPLPDGGVGLTWDRGEAELEITVAGDGTFDALLSTADDETELQPGSTYAEASDLLDRFFALR